MKHLWSVAVSPLRAALAAASCNAVSSCNTVSGSIRDEHAATSEDEGCIGADSSGLN